MALNARIADLPLLHPRLLWDDVIAAATYVLSSESVEPFQTCAVDVRDVPEFGSARVDLRVRLSGLPEQRLERVRRTYEPSRMIELAAIAVAGLALYHCGGHEIIDVAARGTHADYLVDDDRRPLEVAGRSRRQDLRPAWKPKWQRLRDRAQEGFYLFVMEFETRSARLAYGN